MVPKEHKRAVLHDKLQVLRSVTHSHALSKASIIMDASKYIEELKLKIERLNQEISRARSTTTAVDGIPSPVVTVETLQNGFLINIFSERSCSGLLVCILEAFEELGLNLLEARASCTDTFRLEAVGGETQSGNVDAQAVKQAVVRAINNCAAISEEDSYA